MPLVGRSRPSVTDLAPPLEQPRASRYGGLALEFAGCLSRHFAREPARVHFVMIKSQFKFLKLSRATLQILRHACKF